MLDARIQRECEGVEVELRAFSPQLLTSCAEGWKSSFAEQTTHIFSSLLDESSVAQTTHISRTQACGTLFASCWFEPRRCARPPLTLRRYLEIGREGVSGNA